MTQNGLCWKTFHMHMKNKYILLLGGMVYKSSRSRCLMVFFISSVFWYFLSDCSINSWKSSIEIFSYDEESISLFSWLFLFNYIEAMLLGTKTFMIVRSSRQVGPFIIMKCPSLSQVMFLVLRSTLSGLSLQFSYAYFAHGIPFSMLLLSTDPSIYI